MLMQKRSKNFFEEKHNIQFVVGKSSTVNGGFLKIRKIPEDNPHSIKTAVNKIRLLSASFAKSRMGYHLNLLCHLDIGSVKVSLYNGHVPVGACSNENSLLRYYNSPFECQWRKRIDTQWT